MSIKEWSDEQNIISLKPSRPLKDKTFGPIFAGLTGGRDLFFGGGSMPFTQQEKETWKDRKDAYVRPPMNEYYQDRQDQSTSAGIIVGVCLVVGIIIFLITLISPMR